MMTEKETINECKNDLSATGLIDTEENTEAFNDDMLSIVQNELLNTIYMIDNELHKIESVLEMANKVSPGLYNVKSSLLGLRIDALKKIGDFVFDKKKIKESEFGEVKDITDLFNKAIK